VLDTVLKTFSNNMNSKLRTINNSKEWGRLWIQC
jgi:hypothetical protein